MVCFAFCKNRHDFCLTVRGFRLTVRGFAKKKSREKLPDVKIKLVDRTIKLVDRKIKLVDVKKERARIPDLAPQHELNRGRGRGPRDLTEVRGEREMRKRRSVDEANPGQLNAGEEGG